MSANLQSFLHWWTTEKGCFTLDFAGAMLLALEYFIILLGVKRADEISAWLERTRAGLDPKKARALARWLTIGPVAATALALALALFVRVVWADFSHLKAQISQFPNDADPYWWSSRMGRDLLELLKIFCCLGFAGGVYFSRSDDSAQRFNGWLEKLAKWFRELQTGKPLVSQIPVAVTGSLLLGIFTIGLWVGGLFMWIVLRVFELPLRIPRFVLVQRRLRRIAAFVGLAMLTTSYFIRMTTHQKGNASQHEFPGIRD